MTGASTPSSGGAGYHRGTSRTDIATPPELLRAVERRYGHRFEVDLAADAENTAAPAWYSLEDDALQHDWTEHAGNACWCNPPYSDISPWVCKAAVSTLDPLRAPWIAMLLPAAIGSRWYAQWVYPHATTVALRPRVTFRGHQHPYPRDLILAVYDGVGKRQLQLWDWQEE